jgi:hypothetical protein
LLQRMKGAGIRPDDITHRILRDMPTLLKSSKL